MARLKTENESGGEIAGGLAPEIGLSDRARRTQRRRVRKPAGEWWPPARAGRLLEVSPQTLLRWGRAGRIRTYTTPAGHSRVNADDIRAVIAATISGNLDLLVGASVVRAHYQSIQNAPHPAPWYDPREAEAKERNRELGRYLPSLLGRDRPTTWDVGVLAEARELGASWGATARDAGLSVAEAVRSCQVLQDLIMDAIDHLAVDAEQAADRRRGVGQFASEVVIAMIESYSPTAAKPPRIRRAIGLSARKPVSPEVRALRRQYLAKARRVWAEMRRRRAGSGPPEP